MFVNMFSDLLASTSLRLTDWLTNHKMQKHTENIMEILFLEEIRVKILLAKSFFDKHKSLGKRLFNDLDAYDKVSPYLILAAEASPRSFRTEHKES